MTQQSFSDKLAATLPKPFSEQLAEAAQGESPGHWGSFGRGVSTVVASTLESATLPRRMLANAARMFGVDEQLVGGLDAIMRANQPLAEASAETGQRLNYAARYGYPTGPQPFSERVAEAAGSAIPFAASAMVGGAPAASGLGAAVGGASMASEAEAAGASPARQIAATAAGAAIGAGEGMLGAEAAIGKLASGLPATARKSIGTEILKAVAMAGAGESVEEAVQGTLEQAVRTEILKSADVEPTLRAWMQEFGRAWIDQGLPAMVVGGILGGMASAAQQTRDAAPTDTEQPGAPSPLVGAVEPSATAGWPLPAEVSQGDSQVSPGDATTTNSTELPQTTPPAVAPEGPQSGVEVAPLPNAEGSAVETAPILPPAESAASAQTPAVAPTVDSQKLPEVAQKLPVPETVAPTESQVSVSPSPTESRETSAAPKPIEVVTPPEPIDSESTGIKNRTVDKELAAMGFDPAMHGESKTFEEVHQKARETFERDSFAGARLVADLETSQRPPTAEENALLTFEVNRLINVRDTAEEWFNIEPTEERRAAIERAKADYARAAEVVTRAGTQSGQSLAFRRMMIRRDYSLAAMERAVQVAQNGQPLTVDQSAEIKELHGKLKAAMLAHDAYVSESETRRAALEAENEFLRITKKAARPQVRAQRVAKSRENIDKLFTELSTLARRAHAGIDPEIAVVVAKLAAEHLRIGYYKFEAWSEQVVARAGDTIKPYLRDAWDKAQTEHRKELAAPIAKQLEGGAQITSLGRYVSKLAEQFVADGMTDRDAVVDAVHEVLKTIDATITRRQTMDAISGYGEFRPLNQDEVKVRLRDLRGQMQQLGKLEDMAKNMPPKKTGPERRTPSDAERRLIQQVNEAKKKLGIKSVSSGDTIKSTLDAMKTRLRNQMRDMQYQIDTRTKIVREPGESPSDPELDALRAERIKIKRQFDEVFAGENEAKQLAAAIKAVEKSIDDYQRRIEARELAPKQNRPGPTNAELEALRERRNALRTELATMRAAAKPENDPEEVALRAYKTRLANEVARMKERVFYGELGTVVPKQKRAPLELDPEALRLKTDLEQEKRRFAAIVERERLKNRTAGQKTVDAAKEVLNLPRAIKSSWDLSALLRQGAFFTLGHPVQALEHAKRMIRATLSERYTLELDVALRDRPLASFGERSGLELTQHGDALGKHEEAIRSELSDKIPGIKASNRGFTTMLNSQRAAMFDALVRAIPGTPTLEQGKAIANLVNIATGRGNPGKLAPAMNGVGLFLWSPRLLLSRMQLLAGQPLYGGDATTRKLIAKEYARFIVGLAAVYTLAGLAGSDEPEEDPRSSDFGKLKFGSSRLDPLAGLGQVTVLVSRLATGETKKIASGKIVPIRGEVPYGGDDSADIIARFLRTKLTPALGMSIDALSGENVIGEEVTPKSLALDAAIPLSFRDINEAMLEHGIPKGAALGILSLFGMGLQNFETKTEPKTLKP